MKYRFLIIPDDIEDIKDEIIKAKNNREKMWSETQKLMKKINADNVLINKDFGTISAFEFKEEPDVKYWKQYGRFKKNINDHFPKFPKLNCTWGKCIKKEIDRINKIGSLLDNPERIVLNTLKLDFLVPGVSDNNLRPKLFCSTAVYIEKEKIFIAKIPISEKSTKIINDLINENYPRCIEIKESECVAIMKENYPVKDIIEKYK